MNGTVASAAPEASPTHVEGDVRCAQCRYTLTGLPVASACPECGADVRRTLLGNLLELAAPSYLASLVIGSRLILAGIVVWCVCAMLLGGSGFSGHGPPAWLANALLLACMAGGVVTAAGWWRLTARDPAFVGTDRREWVRRAARFSAVAIAGATVVASLLGLLVQARPDGPAAVILGGVALAATAGLPVHLVFGLLYLGSLAARLPGLALRERVRGALRLALTVVASIVMAAGAGVSGFNTAVTIVALVGLLAAFIFLLAYASTLEAAAMELKKAGQRAAAAGPVT